MKTNMLRHQMGMMTLSAALLAGPAFGQTAGLPQINPATGLPATKPGELTPEGSVSAGYEAAAEIKKLIFNDKYEEALERCLAFHNKWKTSAPLIPLLGDWVELGRRYPKAKAALLKIRDHDAREFAEGRGYFALFQEVWAINRFLPQEEETYELFKSFRDKDPELARQCYGMVEGLLVAKGEYQWCYDHMGDPRMKFDSIRQLRDMRLQQNARSKALAEESQRRMAEMRQQHGWTNLPPFSPPDLAGRDKRMTEDHFVNQTRQLIEILVATGHKADAEKLRDEALGIQDDPRLKSAVEDAAGKARTQG